MLTEQPPAPAEPEGKQTRSVTCIGCGSALTFTPAVIGEAGQPGLCATCQALMEEPAQ